MFKSYSLQAQTGVVVSFDLGCLFIFYFYFYLCMSVHICELMGVYAVYEDVPRHQKKTLDLL